MSQTDKNNNTIDIVAALTVNELAVQQNISPTDVLPVFMRSRTAGILYDESTKLWWDGPSVIAEMYREEMSSAKTGEEQNSDEN